MSFHTAPFWFALIFLGCDRSIVVAQIESPDAHTNSDMGALTDVGPSFGLRGDYYNNVNLTGTPVLVRIDPRLEMTWFQIPPGPGLSLIFSVRWQGDLQAEVTGLHSLRLDSDDGSRLWLDDQLLIDQWKGAPNDSTTNINLVAGRRYALRAELYSTGGSGSIRLRWSAPDLPLQVVPQNHFFATP